MRRAVAVCALVIPLSGCLTNPPQQPILSCTECGSLTYYGPPQRNPNVEMAEVLVGGAAKLGQIIVGGEVLKTALDAKNFVVPGGTKETVERVTDIRSDASSTDTLSDIRSDTSNVRDTTFIRDVSDTRISDTSVSDTLVSDTRVSDISSSTATRVGP